MDISLVSVKFLTGFTGGSGAFSGGDLNYFVYSVVLSC